MSNAVLKKLEEHDQEFASLHQQLAAHDTRLTSVETDVKVLKEDVKVLKEDVKVLKEDVKVLKEDVKVLKEDVKVLKDDMVDVKRTMHRFELQQEAQEQKLNQVLDIVQGIAEQVGAREPLERRLDHHEHRLSALESAYKSGTPLR